jgi:hypothetical protein
VAIVAFSMHSILAVVVHPASLIGLIVPWSIGLQLFKRYGDLWAGELSRRQARVLWRQSLAFNLIGVILGLLLSGWWELLPLPDYNGVIAVLGFLIPIVSSVLSGIGLNQTVEPENTPTMNPTVLRHHTPSKRSR